jgi:hypothetical protein
METTNRYEFPTKDKFKARQVTELDFDIAPYRNKLYINLEAIRSKDYEKEMLFHLGIDEAQDKLVELTGEFTKLVFSGHMGSGKTLELLAFKEKVHHQDRYFVVYIDIEKVFEVARFQAEDFFIMLFTELAKTLHNNNIPFPSHKLKELEKDWLGEQEIEEINSSTWGLQADIEKGIKANIFLLFSAKIKGLFASENKVSTKIREKVKKNNLAYIQQFNEILYEVRKILQAEWKKNNSGIGRDILFIIDGSEKLRREICKEIFIHNSFLWRDIQADIICAIPISMHYELENKQAMDFYHACLLPMIKITKDSKPILEKIITNRIDKTTFFADNEAIDLAIRYSGGSIRQLLKLVNAMLRYTRGNPITKEAADITIKEQGRKMWEQLTEEQVGLLNKGLAEGGNFRTGNEKVSLLIFSLVLMKYNGNVKINPLLDDYFKGKTLLTT